MTIDLSVLANMLGSFRDAWIPHTQTQRHGVLAMLSYIYRSISIYLSIYLLKLPPFPI
jgi:hypothetical protein